LKIDGAVLIRGKEIDWREVLKCMGRAGMWLLNAISTLILCAAGLFLLWILLQVTVYASFTIPTGSMRPTIQPGDRVLVNKLVMGGRVFDVFDAAAGEQVTIRRIPGFGKLKRNDVIVFNFPYQGMWDSIAMDFGLYYMKRCVAVPGDTFEIDDCIMLAGRGAERDTVGYVPTQRAMQRELRRRDKFKNYAGVADGMVMQAFPNNEKVGWTVRDFGPLYVPEEGGKIALDTISAIVYRNAIEWESGAKLTVRDDGRICLGDSAVTEYVFRKDYCCVCGDYAYDSRDSRYWGLLPMEFVVGKSVLIWDSVDKYSDRRVWSRVMRAIK